MLNLEVVFWCKSCMNYPNQFSLYLGINCTWSYQCCTQTNRWLRPTEQIATTTEHSHLCIPYSMMRNLMTAFSVLQTRPCLNIKWVIKFNTLRLRQNGRHFPDNIFKWIFFNENVSLSITISLKFVPKVQINIIPALVQIMAWHQIGNKPLSEPMLTRFTDAYMQHQGEIS